MVQSTYVWYISRVLYSVVPKFLVYTLHCGEPDFPKCQAAIAAQKGVVIKHQVVNDLPEVEAHNLAYQAFNDADHTWIRAKIDADVELIDDQVLARVAQRLAELPMAHGLDPLVHDFLTGSEIHAGMAFYTHHIRFNVQHDHLYCDRNVIINPYAHYIHSHQHVLGRHMHHCSELTAFRYGFHRGLKRQTSIFNTVKDAHEKHGDTRRLMAIKGFEAAMAGDFGSTGHNYGDEALHRLFGECLDQIMKT